jgi:hypothetical protein
VGVLFDYFRAEDDARARATRELLGGPLSADAMPAFDGVATKGVFPDPHLEQLVAHVARVPYERGPRTSWGLWPPPDTPPPTDESSPWLTDPSVERLATRIRDSLADIEADDIARLAEVWAPDISHPVDAAAATITGLAALAHRARESDQDLYCWSSL